MSYQFKSRVRYSEVDEDQRLTLPGIVNYFQDCSTFQSESSNVGLEVLYRRNRVWILAYWQIRIVRRPKLGEEIATETWPYKFKGFYGERNFRMKDAEGNVLAYAASMWIYLDTQTGHPAKIDEDIYAAYRLEEALDMGTLSRKIPVPPVSEKKDSFAVMRTHLDTNHHVNNGQYILMAQEYLPEDFKVAGVRVEYKKSAVLHDVIVPFVSTENGRCTVSLCGTDEKPYAVVEFEAEV